MRTRLLALLLALVTLAVACGGTDSDDAESASFGDARDAGVPEPAIDFEADDADFDEVAAEEAGDFGAEPPSDANALTTGSAGAPPAAQLPDLGRDIIYTAWLELGATDVSAATRDAIRTVEGLGGFLFSQETRGGTGGSSVLVFKILPEQFQRAVTELGSIGAVRSQAISAEDVTDVVVDLQSRITTAEASVARLQDFLEDAESIEVIASLESQLLERETTLERLRGQLRSVQNQVDLATINVTISELLNQPGLSLSVASYEGHDGGFNCLDAHRVGAIEADTEVTICYQLTNVGDTDLVDLAIDDPVLGASLGDLVVVEGPVTGLAPGETLVVAHEIEVAESLRMRTAATATALDADGNPLEDEVRATAPRLRIDVLDDDSDLPGFGEVLRDSWSVLVTVVTLVALGLVAAAPFLALALIVGPIIWFVARRIARRRRDRAPSTAPAPSSDRTAAPATPAPPAPGPPPPPPPGEIASPDVTSGSGESTVSS